jgi:hypothetical protein
MDSGESAVGLVFPISVAEVITTRKRSSVTEIRPKQPLTTLLVRRIAFERLT